MSAGTAAVEEVLEADLKRQSHHYGPHYCQCLGCPHLWLHLQSHEALSDRHTRQTRPSSGDLASHPLFCNPLKHLHNVKIRFHCLQMFLSLDFQCRMTFLNQSRRCGVEKSCIFNMNLTFPLLPFLLNSLMHARHNLIPPSQWLADVGNSSA